MIASVADLIREAQEHVRCVDAAAAKKLYDGSDNAVIIDVREADSAAASRLADAINISRGLLEMKVEKAVPDADTLILTHCGGGGRASLSAYTLQRMGYTNVYAITAPFEEIRKVFG